MKTTALRVGGWRGAACAALLAAVPLLAGCPKQRSTMDRPPEVNPPPAVERSAEARSEELGDLARRFASTAQRLPGRTPDEHRAAVQQVFADLSQILPVLFGPEPDGPQRQQLRVVESARSQLAAAPQGLAPEPTIDSGLRAARDALSSVARNRYFEQANLAQAVDKLSVTVGRLDTSRGVPHQQTVTDVVDLMSELVTGMARAMDERIEEQQQEQAGKARPDDGDKPDAAGKSDDDVKPTEDEPKPTEDEPKPTEDEPKPTEGERKPTGDEAKPTEDESKPTEDEPKPPPDTPEEMPEESAEPPEPELG